MRDFNAREFRWLVDLRQPARVNTNGSDEVSFPTATYQTYAKIESLTGRELQNAKEQQADVTHKITMRANSQTASVGPSWQIWFADALTGNTSKYEVEWVGNVEQRNRLIVAMAKEIVTT